MGMIRYCMPLSRKSLYDTSKCLYELLSKDLKYFSIYMCFFFLTPCMDKLDSAYKCSVPPSNLKLKQFQIQYYILKLE